MVYNESKYNKNWKTMKLSDLGEFARGKSTHRPRNDKNLFEGGGYPLVQTGEIKEANLYITHHTQEYGEFGLQQSKLWDAETLCITIAANIAETALLAYPMCFPDSVVGFKAYKEVSSEKFMYYVFDFIRNSIQNAASGSTQDNINIDYLTSLDFKVPDKIAQDKMVELLSAIDEKILMLKKRKKRIKTIIIIALIAVFVLIAVKLTSSFLYYRSDDYKLLKAKEFMANEQYSQAMEYLNDMEDKKVANQQIKKIQCKEAKSYFEKEEYDKAIAIYHKWGEKEEERKVIQQKALMLLYENKFTEAIKLYEQIKDEDNLIFAYGRLARYYRDSGEYDKAIEIYNKIDSEEGKESVYEFQAYNLIDQKRYDEVEKLYKYIKDENILKDIQEEVCRQKTEN